MMQRSVLTRSAVAAIVLALAGTASCGDPKVDHREVAKHPHAAPVTLREACLRVDDELPRVVSPPTAYAALEQVLTDLYDEGGPATRKAIETLRPSVKAMANRRPGRRVGTRKKALDEAVDRFTNTCAAAGSTALK